MPSSLKVKKLNLDDVKKNVLKCSIGERPWRSWALEVRGDPPGTFYQVKILSKEKISGHVAFVLAFCFPRGFGKKNRVFVTEDISKPKYVKTAKEFIESMKKLDIRYRELNLEAFDLDKVLDYDKDIVFKS